MWGLIILKYLSFRQIAMRIYCLFPALMQWVVPEERFNDFL